MPNGSDPPLLPRHDAFVAAKSDKPDETIIGFEPADHAYMWHVTTNKDAYWFAYIPDDAQLAPAYPKVSKSWAYAS